MSSTSSGLYEEILKPKQDGLSAQVSATAFLNKEMPHTFFKTRFFLKAYQNLYVKY